MVLLEFELNPKNWIKNPQNDQFKQNRNNKKKNIPKYVCLIYRLGFSQLSDFLSLSQTGLILPDP